MPALTLRTSFHPNEAKLYKFGGVYGSMDALARKMVYFIGPQEPIDSLKASTDVLTTDLLSMSYKILFTGYFVMTLFKQGFMNKSALNSNSTCLGGFEGS